MTISAEILDCAFGRPAEGVQVTLLREVGPTWQCRASDRTDVAGVLPSLEPHPVRGRYRLVFDLDQHYSPLGTEAAVSSAEVTFRVLHPGERVHMVFVITPTSYLAIRRTGARDGMSYHP